MDLELIIKEKKCTVIDVRSPIEFIGGNVMGSINIPIHEIPHRIKDLKQLPSPLVICSKTGARSLAAQHILEQQKIECYNAGSWLNVIRFPVK